MVKTAGERAHGAHICRKVPHKVAGLRSRKISGESWILKNTGIHGGGGYRNYPIITVLQVCSNQALSVSNSVVLIFCSIGDKRLGGRVMIWNRILQKFR